MTGEQNQADGAADPLLSWESIPGAGGSRSVDDDDETQSVASAYDQVRGLLAEPGPRVGDGRLSEKMTEEIESFEQRWNQRPVPSLVAAGKKMTESSASTGLGRLLGLTTPTRTALDSDQDADLVTDAEDTLDQTVDQDDDAGAGEQDLITAPEPATASEDCVDTTPQSAPETIEASIEDRASVEHSATITGSTRLTAVQAAYRDLNPLEAEIFHDQAGLLHRQQAAHDADRSRRLAIQTLGDYESRIHDLQRDLGTERAQSAIAAEEAARVIETLISKVDVLQARVDVARAEIESLRRGDTDDSDGGAGRQVIKGSDDLRPATVTEVIPTAEDRPEDTAEDDDSHSRPDVDVDVDRSEESISPETSGEGESALLDALERLAGGEDEPKRQQEFGE